MTPLEIGLLLAILGLYGRIILDMFNKRRNNNNNPGMHPVCARMIDDIKEEMHRSLDSIKERMNTISKRTHDIADTCNTLKIRVDLLWDAYNDKRGSGR